MQVYYFGAWSSPSSGHHLRGPGGGVLPRHPLDERLDKWLAPRRRRDGTLCWMGQGASPEHKAHGRAPIGPVLRGSMNEKDD